jgi:hypothetical protein
VTVNGGYSVHIIAPDGRKLEPGPDTDKYLSHTLGRTVRLIDHRPDGLTIERSVPSEILARGIATSVEVAVGVLGRSAPHGGFFDRAPVHIVATSSLTRLAGEASWREIAPRYRANIVVDVPDFPAFEETSWIGQIMAIGSALVRVILPTPRCAVPTLAQPSLPENLEALRSIVKLNRVRVANQGRLPCLGVYAEVIQQGVVHVGDAVYHTA